MKRITIALVTLATFFFAQHLYAQHFLQLDDGAGHYSTIQASSPGGTYTLPSIGGTLVTTGSISTVAWMLTGNTLTAGVDGTDNVLGTLAGSTLTPVNIVVNGVRAMRYMPVPALISSAEKQQIQLL